MCHVNAQSQGVDERMINVHYYYYTTNTNKHDYTTNRERERESACKEVPGEVGGREVGKSNTG